MDGQLPEAQWLSFEKAGISLTTTATEELLSVLCVFHVSSYVVTVLNMTRHSGLLRIPVILYCWGTHYLTLSLLHIGKFLPCEHSRQDMPHCFDTV
jgi:hypothetical protein